MPKNAKLKAQITLSGYTIRSCSIAAAISEVRLSEAIRGRCVLRHVEALAVARVLHVPMSAILPDLPPSPVPDRRSLSAGA